MKNNQAMQLLTKKMKGLDKNNINYTDFIKEKILHKDDKLYYLSVVGSQLRGTNNEDSDLDIKGIFLPSKESLILGEKREQYGPYTTSKGNEKNGPDDVDIELWSIHKFFKLLQKGDTNAVDLLFSYSNPTAWIYRKSTFNSIFNHRTKLIGKKALEKAFIGYSYGQYKRYEVKGFNFHTLKLILKYFKELPIYNGSQRLEHYVHDMINWVKERTNELQVYIVEDKKDKYVEINGYKKYPLGIRIKQFIDYIQKWADTYGSRVKNNDEGIDFTSISHAFCTLLIAENLAKTGDFKFPLKYYDANDLLNIKNGEFDYKNLITDLKQYVEEVRELIRNSKVLTQKPDVKFMRNHILELYGKI
ncbi:MAG: DNA polymerase beta superfamily protein [Halanaerobiales bacterium]